MTKMAWNDIKWPWSFGNFDSKIVIENFSFNKIFRWKWQNKLFVGRWVNFYFGAIWRSIWISSRFDSRRGHWPRKVQIRWIKNDRFEPVNTRPDGSKYDCYNSCYRIGRKWIQTNFYQTSKFPKILMNRIRYSPKKMTFRKFKKWVLF